MDETDRPDDRRADGSWVLPNSESRRQRNHEAAQSGIQKRKKTRTYPRLSCKIEYFSRQITPADQSLPNSSRATPKQTLAPDLTGHFCALSLTRTVSDCDVAFESDSDVLVKITTHDNGPRRHAGAQPAQACAPHIPT